MTLVPNLEILPGLEEAYFKIVQFSSALTQNQIILRRSSPARKLRSRVAQRSLFIKYQDLYNGLSNDRHIAWTTYWGTLPFGNHIGANGWPGSGFSAFIYVNAPRYQQGLDPLLDPPLVTNLIYNGDFALGGDGWSVEDGLVDFSSGQATFDPDVGGFFKTTPDHVFPMLCPASFHCEFDYSVSGGELLAYLETEGGGSGPFFQDYIDESGHASFDFDSPDFEGEIANFKFLSSCSSNSGAFIKNISIVPL